MRSFGVLGIAMAAALGVLVAVSAGWARDNDRAPDKGRPPAVKYDSGPQKTRTCEPNAQGLFYKALCDNESVKAKGKGK